MIIREATHDDITAIARVHVQADWETYSGLFGSKTYRIDLADSEHRWRHALQRGDTLLVAGEGSQIVGLGHALKDEIRALYLLRSYQRRGIGRALLLSLLTRLNGRGVTEARFEVVGANLKAIRFYESLGARTIERCTNSSGPGAIEDHIVFVISTSSVR
jgi:ribosomal protein S18 acetylase RimI-like enzyme